MFTKKNIWSNDDSKGNIDPDLKKSYSILREDIIDYMTRCCWMLDKDYYLGFTEFNEYPTIFYKEISNGRTNLLVNDLKNAISEASEHNAEYIPVLRAFKIDAVTCCIMDELYFNVMKENDFEEAIKNEPERWKFYLKHRK